MGESAKVKSIEAIQSFRETLARFGEDAGNALGAVEMEIRRAQDYLQHELPSYWKQQIRRWDQAMAEARSQLHRKNLAKTEGYIPDTTEEKEAWRIARQRLYEAERKVEQVRRWVPQLQHAIAEYHGQSRPLADMATGDLARSLELLDRMIRALEGYVSTPPPRTSGRTEAGFQTPTASESEHPEKEAEDAKPDDVPEPEESPESDEATP
ncbi:hypothetical protein BH23PLA1_BH23PLA1_37240 [soil metagenome]